MAKKATGMPITSSAKGGVRIKVGTPYTVRLGADKRTTKRGS